VGTCPAREDEGLPRQCSLFHRTPRSAAAYSVLPVSSVFCVFEKSHPVPFHTPATSACVLRTRTRPTSPPSSPRYLGHSASRQSVNLRSPHPPRGPGSHYFRPPFRRTILSLGTPGVYSLRFITLSVSRIPPPHLRSDPRMHSSLRDLPSPRPGCDGDDRHRAACIGAERSRTPCGRRSSARGRKWK